MSSETSTNSFRPAHFYLLLTMIAATAAVLLTPNTHPVALILLSAAIVGAGFAGIALHHALAGFFGGGHVKSQPLADRARDALLREKALVLRSIKELEFDHSMGKVSDADFADLGGRLRARALTLMQDLDRATASQPAAEPAKVLPATRACASCGVVNDPDARFCKSCGREIEATA